MSTTNQDSDQATREEQLAKYRAMAQQYMEKHNCRWSEACLAIKRQYPEARVAFGAPTFK